MPERVFWKDRIFCEGYLSDRKALHNLKLS